MPLLFSGRRRSLSGTGGTARLLIPARVRRPIRVASSALSRAWGAALELGDEERVAVTCGEVVTSKRQYIALAQVDLSRGEWGEALGASRKGLDSAKRGRYRLEQDADDRILSPVH